MKSNSRRGCNSAMHTQSGKSDSSVFTYIIHIERALTEFHIFFLTSVIIYGARIEQTSVSVAKL